MSFSQMKILLIIIKYIETLHNLNIKNNPQIISTSIRNNRSLGKYEKLISIDYKIYDTKLRSLNKKINKNKDDVLVFNEMLNEKLKLYDKEINKYKEINKDYTYENHYINNEIQSNYKNIFIYDKYIFNKNINTFLKKNKILCKHCKKKVSKSLDMFKTNFAFILSETKSPMSLIDTIIVESFTSLLTLLRGVIVSGIAIGIGYLLKLLFLDIFTLNPGTIPIFIILLFTIFVVIYLEKSKKKEKELMYR
ncbi:Plasmodium exported protein (hyp13), unknown function [Plasmodium sp. gorilla clade G3]|nr:Plasmodium exported protein (hyp13), unknown function [Plasmodium sp. gorilla clade G3]